MEGQTILSEKLKFVENKTKFKVGNNVTPGRLITAANQHGLLYLGLDNTIKALALDGIINPGSSNQTINLDSWRFSANLTFKPSILSISRNGYSSVLLVAGHDNSCPVIEFFDIDTQTSVGIVHLKEFSGTKISDYAWQPVYYESIVAICLSSGHLLIVAVDKREKRAGVVYKEQQNSLTCCWSPKGKNLAIGMTNGQVRRLEIGQLSQDSTKFVFKDVDKSLINFAHLTAGYRAIKLRWINRKYIMCVHARPTDPAASISIFTIKPTEPYRYFTNVCIDSLAPEQITDYSVDLLNLSNAVVCVSNASCDVSVIGVNDAEQAKRNDLSDWNLITIDSEGGRVELPLDANNSETYARGTTIASSERFNNPIIVIYTNDGVICSYSAIHTEQILKLPETQKLENCPIKIPKPSVTFAEVALPPKVQQDSYSINKRSFDSISALETNISAIKKGIEFNDAFLSVFSEVNYLKTQLDAIQDIHQIHKDVHDVVKKDIEALDIGMLENYYLLEYIKSGKGGVRKKSPDPIIMKKVETLKQKTKSVAEKLKDLNNHVDVSWEDFCRRRTANKPGRVLNSLDIIYKTLATNQKIINHLKKKASYLPAIAPANPKSMESNQVIALREISPARMKQLKDFLASRDTVPVRRPESHIQMR